jgi:N-acyl-D-aspartate/D-glutamate deacylase
MHDLVIRGGTLVDGTGAAQRVADIAVDGATITAVGGGLGPGRREIGAQGLLVTPGFVDVHTHYDGQATWDPFLTPSSCHGVTTAIFGNCGVGFAPVRPGSTDYLINLMEGVEDIPGITLTEGLKWDWESFPDYLDALARLPRTIDVAAQLAHHPMRVYVMGERAIAREQATAEDIEAMARLTEEALKAGAAGFTTSRTDQHKTLAGDLVPGRTPSMRSFWPSAGRWAAPAAVRSACSPTSRTKPPSSAGCARWRRTAAGRSGSCSPTAATIRSVGAA